MKKTLILTFSLLLTFTPLLTGAENEKEEKDKEVKVSVFAGVRVGNSSDYTGKIWEYLPLHDGFRPIVGAAITGTTGKTFYQLKSLYNGDSRDQRHALSLDAARIVNLKINYDSLLHRLDHDPLSNLDVASEARSAVFHTDYNPNDEYNISRSEFTGKATFALPSVSFVKFYTNFRDEHRKGTYQARTLSKCSSCHVVAKSRSIDNSNRDYQLGGNVFVGKANIDYSYTKREFRENGAAPTHTYLKVEHPEIVAPVFSSRIQYGMADGPLPFDVVPDTNKDTHLIKAIVPLNETMTVSGHFVNSTVKNNLTALKIDSSSFAGAFSTRIGKRGVFNARFSRIRIKNADVFVDVNEPVDVAGPFAGETYAEAYPEFGSPDYTRYSALSRETRDFDANLRYRLTRKLKFRMNYEYKTIDRDYYDVSSTNSHTVRAMFDFKPVKQLKLQLSGRIKQTAHPFTNLNAGVAPSVQDYPVSNPFVGEQFYVFHSAREANLTNLPTDLGEIKATMSWAPSYRFAINGIFLYRDQTNDELNFSTWDNTTLNYGASFWYAVGNKVSLSGAYYLYDESISSLFAIPVMEGCGGGIIGGFPGTLTDTIDYDIDTHTALLTTNYAVSEKISLYGNLAYNNSLARMSDLMLDTNQVDFIPGNEATALEFSGITETIEYSKISIKQLIGDVGLSFRFSDALSAKSQATYYFYDDLAPYLFDGGGSAFSFFVGLGYNF